MAKNIVYKPGYKMRVACSHPAVPVSGGPIRYGALTGIALTLEDAAFLCTVDFGPFVATFSVHDEVGGGIAIGDPLFYDDADGGGKINNDAVNGYFFGMALAVVGAGATTTIAVLHTPSPGAGAYAALGVSTAKIANGAVTEGKINPADLTGLVCKVVANANVIGGILVIHRIDMAGGATATVNVLLTYKTRVLDAWVVNKAVGTAGDTITVKNVATAISDAVDINKADRSVSRVGTINNAQHEIIAGTNLAITETDGGGNDSPACVVYVLGIRVD